MSRGARPDNAPAGPVPRDKVRMVQTPTPRAAWAALIAIGLANILLLPVLAAFVLRSGLLHTLGQVLLPLLGWPFVRALWPQHPRRAMVIYWCALNVMLLATLVLGLAWIAVCLVIDGKCN